jgi:hypothetical protein
MAKAGLAGLRSRLDHIMQKATPQRQQQGKPGANTGQSLCYITYSSATNMQCVPDTCVVLLALCRNRTLNDWIGRIAISLYAW